MEEFISSHPSDYAKFRLCENQQNPQPCKGFWPVLFDYRGKSTLSGVEASIGARGGAYKILASILSDAYTYYGVSSITVKKMAFVELKNGDIFEITDYRVPSTHCTVNPGAEVRLDQPKFTVREAEHLVTISLHDKYVELLPCFRPNALIPFDGQADEVLDDNLEADAFDDDLNMDTMFDAEEEEDEIFSQVESIFSQVSLEEEGWAQSPDVKRIKLDLGEEKEQSQMEKNQCPHCKVYISGNLGQINRHIWKSCPESPDIDPLEAERRKKRLNKKLEIKQEIEDQFKSEIKSEPEHKERGKTDQEGDWIGGDCGCRGTEHQPDVCLRLRGGAGHARLPRNIPPPHLNPDPDFLPPRQLREIIPVIQALDRKKFTNRQNRWIAGLGPPRNQLNIRNSLWHRVVSKSQLPFMFKDTEFNDLFYFNKQQLYQIRNAVVNPMLAQRAAQAQGVRGARNSLPHTLTPDSLTTLFLSKVRLNQKDRVVSAQLGIKHRHAQKWLLALRNFYFTTDPFIQRNLNLSNQANLQAIFQQGIQATARNQRITGLYGH